MPAGWLTALARGEDAPAAVRLLARAQHSKHLLLLKAVVDEAAGRRHPQAAQARDGYALLADVQRRAPEAAATVIRYPAVGAWALRTLWHLLHGHPPDGCAAAQPRRLAALAAGAAVRGRVELAAELWTEGEAVTLPSVGRAVFPGAADGSRVRVLAHRGGGAELVAGRARVPVPLGPPPLGQAGLDGWQGTRRLAAGFEVLLDDVDPFRFHPEARQRDRLPGEEAARWAAPVASGWRLLTARHPVVAEEVSRLVSALVPLSTTRHRMTSASTRSAFGCVALSCPPDALGAALTLAHEVQHVKLSALMDLFPLVDTTAPPRLHYAPWRDDPRPPTGLLHGAYAFTGVAAFWSRQRAAETGAAALEAHAQFARWRRAALDVTEVLLSGEHLTPLGRRFVLGMAAALRELCEQSVPPEAAERARRAADRHRSRWLARHGGDPRG
jgi:HEXXH motif-containing protein